MRNQFLECNQCYVDAMQSFFVLKRR